MYIRDPAGNLVEIDWPDITTLDRSVIGTIRSERWTFTPESSIGRFRNGPVRRIIG
jgi:hypothetical protein